MGDLSSDMLAALGTPKALTLGCYGEDIAAYRYLLLAEKADRQQDADEFREMVIEEQGHRDRLQALLDKYYAGAKFVLTPEEKDVVESGSRKFDIRTRAQFEDALRMVIDSEGRTAQFYDRMEPFINEPEIRAIFRELADEGVEHRQRLCELAAENGIAVQ